MVSNNLKRGWILLTMMVGFVLSSNALAQSDDPPPPEPLILTDKREKYPLGLHLEILEANHHLAEAWIQGR